MRERTIIAYADIEGLATSTVPGQISALAFGLIGEGEGVPVVAMLGRFHPYEGYQLSQVVYPIRLLALLGVKDIIITNAAGGLNPSNPVGTIVVVHDHIALPNLTGPLNALLGPVLTPPFDTRFVPLSNAYSFSLRKLVFKAAYNLGLPRDALAEGTYAWVSGPTYETPAEGRFLRSIGADVVGMSTIPEVVAACQAGLQVIVLSLVTNVVVIPETYASPREEFEAEESVLSLPIRLEHPENIITTARWECWKVGRHKAEVMKQLVEAVVVARDAERKQAT
ncbi:nucleoside phosphorylase domain-containing protein [Cantharellus anzutake]|uniref:nucleoside phosphorylase domain-containing protein n=1 Tax=Cantharellus anzutake TaxID=1750568 RepID=UPI00190728FE|nr:nucleoside phosphorylase domain-containing protein [Cantharellus anzutake]KAF8318318.1 nucleoside phosphorylase domain-containing protein [Cantharellus anzutake]